MKEREPKTESFTIKLSNGNILSGTYTFEPLFGLLREKTFSLSDPDGNELPLNDYQLQIDTDSHNKVIVSYPGGKDTYNLNESEHKFIIQKFHQHINLVAPDLEE